MFRRTHPNHFTTIRTDYTKPQQPWQPKIVEEAKPQKMEPIRRVVIRPKHSKFQRE